MFLSEDGGRPSKHAVVKTLRFYIYFACSNFRFLKTSSSIPLNRVLQIEGRGHLLRSNAGMGTFDLICNSI